MLLGDRFSVTCDFVFCWNGEDKIGTVLVQSIDVVHASK